MKNRLLLSTLICALAAAPGVFAQDAKPAAAAPAEKETTELGKSMEKMSAAFRKLRTRVSDATKNEESLVAVADLRAAAEAAAKLEPAMKSDVADYRAKMKAMIEDIVKLQDALKASNNEEAAKLFAKLGAAQKEGHDIFRPKKKT